ncbi:MAG: flavodoxin family protein [Balneolaceae bacterium]
MEKPDFTGLKALFMNCTLKKSPRQSNTEGLMRVAMHIMKKNNIEVDYIRLVDHDVAFGMGKDMTEKGWDKDDWPALSKKVMDADILVIGTPIWEGDRSSVSKLLTERLDAMSGELNDKGQSIYYGKTGGCLVTGNEDGYQQCVRNILFSLERLGFTNPPQAGTGWVGAAGPGASYMDEEGGGKDSDFTQSTTTFMTWNLMHMAKLLKANGGFPAYGNQPEKWKEGKNFDHPNKP